MTEERWVEGGVCVPYCPPPQRWNGVTCVCNDFTPKNNEGYCCELDYATNDNTVHGICGCHHENEHRKCSSFMNETLDADCPTNDECVCDPPYTRNSWGHCCGIEA
jgi:hypothetical protein